MKRILFRAVGLALLVAISGCAAGYEQTSQGGPPMGAPHSQIDVSYFYANLQSDGQWFRDSRYGWCWTPYDMSADWRPYSDGHWVYTDYGWSWASNEPWGWATYHYGRWFFDDSYGWAWVPGTEWAPAWVAWRYSDDYVGWAPLPPEATWDAGAGLAFQDQNVIQPNEWCFVPRSHVLDVNVRLEVASVGRNVTMLERSRDATRFEVRDRRPADVGIDVGLIGRSVPRVSVVDADRPTRSGGRTLGGGVAFYRPTVRPMPAEQPPVPLSAQSQTPIPERDLQRVRDEQQRKLENDLTAERARLAADQANELKARTSGPGVDEIRKRHAVEQQAFEAHAAQQRQVLMQRFQKQVFKFKNHGNGRGNDNDHGDKAKGNDKADH